MDPRQWLQNYQKKIDGIRQASEQLKENLGNSLVTMSSPDEAVTVTIGPNGSLKNLSLSPRASEHSPQQLGSLIMTTVRRAQRQMAEKVVAAVAEFGGAEGDAAKLTRNYLPEDPDDRVTPNDNVSSFDQHLTEPQVEALSRHAAPQPAPVPAAAPVPQPASRPRAPRVDAVEDDGFEENPW
jgi:DNA-binding protein YbaB